LYSNGARLFNEDHTESLLHEPEAIEALEWLTALNHTYGVTTGSLAIMSNTAAMATGPVPFGEEAF
jgi:ABC-type glycerol-3-phosphate transport system substrate-binding protein